MSVSDKANGDQIDLTTDKTQTDVTADKTQTDVTTDKTQTDVTTDKTLISAPKPQRKIRLNRRGFHLSNNPIVGLSDSSVQQNSNINGSNDGSEDKNKKDVSQRRIISLSSVKNSLTEKQTIKGKESNIITLKRNNTDKTEIAGKAKMSSSSDPPKKKHKPITWP